MLVIGDGHSAANAIGFSGGAGRGKIHRHASCGPRAAANRRPCEEVPKRSAARASRGRRFRECDGGASTRFPRVERRAMIESVSQNNAHVVVTLTAAAASKRRHRRLQLGTAPTRLISSSPSKCRRDRRGARLSAPSLHHHRLPLCPRREAGRPGMGEPATTSSARAATGDRMVLAADGIGAVGDDIGGLSESRRGSAIPPVPMLALDTLWFQVAGTVCNIECTHCFHLLFARAITRTDESLAELQMRLDEAGRWACASTTSRAASRS